jgi:hypothetical protein
VPWDEELEYGFGPLSRDGGGVMPTFTLEIETDETDAGAFVDALAAADGHLPEFKSVRVVEPMALKSGRNLIKQTPVLMRTGVNTYPVETAGDPEPGAGGLVWSGLRPEAEPPAARFDYIQRDIRANYVTLVDTLREPMEVFPADAMMSLIGKPVTEGQPHGAARCRSKFDGECHWAGCPQLRDGEPEASGRHCPLDCEDDE